MTEGPRIYSLPRLGPASDALALSSRAAAMAFNTISVSVGIGMGRADAPMRALTRAAAKHGLKVVVELPGETWDEAGASASVPPSDEDGGIGAVACGAAAPGDGVAVLERRPRSRQAAADPLRHWLGLGVGGFVCHAAHRRAALTWRRTIADAKALSPDLVFIADTLAAGEEGAAALADAGFDYLFNSVKWWDFDSPWLLEQYERQRRIAPSIGFPEASDERLAVELLAAGFPESQIEARYRQAYAFAAAFSSGVMLPAGFEYGCCETGDEAADRRFDLVPFIAAINRQKAAIPVLNTDGPQRRLTPPGDPLVVLLREGEGGGERGLILVNASDEFEREIAVGDLLGEAGLGYLDDRLNLVETLPDGGELPAAARVKLAPLDAKVLRAALRPLKRVETAPPPSVARDAGHRPEWQAEARIQIEKVVPEIDAGRYPAKCVAGDEFQVEADLLRHGHDRLAAVLRYRFEDQEWQEAPFAPVENDRRRASFRPDRVGRWHYTIAAWTDRFASWRADFEKRREAGQDTALELVEGERLVAAALSQAAPADAERLRQIRRKFTVADTTGRTELMLSAELLALMTRSDDRADKVQYGRELELIVDRPEARFSAWYEMFPRSQGRVEGTSATFDDCIGRLDEIAALGFDVVYLVPIHPIGRINRKGRDNAVIAMPDDPGSPYAIGGAEGGHRAVHPELGTLDDFRRFVAAAAALGIEVALDFAIQCAPDHPWVRDHKRWFEYRPDGSIRYAENPPKKYEDIVNVDFYNPDRDGLWRELRDTVLFWVEQGVRIFRVDNPHTKPLPFWEWMIREVKARCPEAIFLSEAFTRPKMMRALAKAGFSQSYTYFTWRDSKPELTEYLTELTQGPAKDYFRPNFFTNTPDIMPFFLQQGGRPAFRIRMTLAGTLSPAYGIYNGFELCENRAIPGREEYLHSEKYEYKVWDWDRPGNIKRDIAILNRFRRGNPALHELTNLRFLDCPDPNILAYAKATADLHNIVVVAVNLDPHGLHAGEIALPLDAWGIGWDREFSVEEAFTGHFWRWRGGRQWLSLDPQHNPAMLMRIGAD